MVQHKNPVEAQAAMGMSMPPWQQDFTSDSEAGHDMVVPFESFNDESVNNSSDFETPAHPSPLLSPTKHSKLGKKEQVDENPAMKLANQGKNPVILNELKPGLDYKLEEATSTSASNRQFTVKVELDGQSFEGTGPSKKMSKQALAKAVLSKVYKCNFNPAIMASSSGKGSTQGQVSTEVCNKVEMDQSVADTVGRMVLAKYDELMK